MLVENDSIELVHKGEKLPLDATLQNAGITEGTSLKAMPVKQYGYRFLGFSSRKIYPKSRRC